MLNMSLEVTVYFNFVGHRPPTGIYLSNQSIFPTRSFFLARHLLMNNSVILLSNSALTNTSYECLSLVQCVTTLLSEAMGCTSSFFTRFQFQTTNCYCQIWLEEDLGTPAKVLLDPIVFGCLLHPTCFHPPHIIPLPALCYYVTWFATIIWGLFLPIYLHCIEVLKSSNLDSEELSHFWHKAILFFQRNFLFLYCNFFSTSSVSFSLLLLIVSSCSLTVLHFYTTSQLFSKDTLSLPMFFLFYLIFS